MVYKLNIALFSLWEGEGKENNALDKIRFLQLTGAFPYGLNSSLLPDMQSPKIKILLWVSNATTYSESKKKKLSLSLLEEFWPPFTQKWAGQLPGISHAAVFIFLIWNFIEIRTQSFLVSAHRLTTTRNILDSHFKCFLLWNTALWPLITEKGTKQLTVWRSGNETNVSRI